MLLQRTFALGFLLLLLSGSGCGDAASVRPSRVEVGLVPAAIQSHADGGWEDQPIAAAEITVSGVTLVGGGEGPQLVDLPLTETPIRIDILNLESSGTMLAAALVPGERYTQLRIEIESATVTLMDGYHFADGTSTRELKIPSGMTSGIKVELLGPLDTDGSSFIRILLHLDPELNFVIQGGDGDSGQLDGILFTPRIQEDRRESRPRSGLPL